MARHRLCRRDTSHLDRHDENRIAGQGFCVHCVEFAAGAEAADTNSSRTIHLAQLECEDCQPPKGSTCLKQLCHDCDQLIHQTIDADEHTRLILDESDDETELQQFELFPIAGISGLHIHHHDEMESYAGRVWPGSMMLARYCEKMDQDTPGIFNHKRILELGCGCQFE